MSSARHRRVFKTKRAAMELGESKGLPLTPQNWCIIDALLAGNVTINQIARALNRKPSTIGTALHEIYIKTGAEGKVDLVLMLAGYKPRPANLERADEIKSEASQ